MKTYNLNIDLTVGIALTVEAENEQEAIRIARTKVRNLPQYYAGKGWYVDDDVVEIEEEE